MDDLVVVLVSEELGTWPKRLPDVHSRDNLEQEGTTEATYTNLSDRCRIFRAKEVKQVTQHLRMNLWQSGARIQVSSQGHSLPMTTASLSSLANPPLNLINRMDGLKLWTGSVPWG